MKKDGWTTVRLKDLAGLMKKKAAEDLKKRVEPSLSSQDDGAALRADPTHLTANEELASGTSMAEARGVLRLKGPSNRVPLSTPSTISKPVFTAHPDSPKPPAKTSTARAKPRPPPRPRNAAAADGIVVRSAPLPPSAKHTAPSISGGERTQQQWRASLTAVAADVARLNIRMSSSVRSPLKLVPQKKKFLNPAFFQKIKRFASSAPKALEPSPAIVGFDFGTAFSKAVIQWRSRHYAVPWFDAKTDADRCLLPSTLFMNEDGGAALAFDRSSRSAPIDGIKARLLALDAAELAATPPAVVEAVMFLAAALRHTFAWFKGVAASQGGDVSTWRLNIGLPAEPWQDEPLREGLQRIGVAALLLSESGSQIDSNAATQSLNDAALGAARPVAIVAEFAAQLASYMKGAQRQDDLHMLIDVGAGTVDLVAFNSHSTADAEVLPLAGAAVERLGAHYLLAALVGPHGQHREWDDAHASQADSFFAKRNHEPVQSIDERRKAFDRVFRFALGNLGSEAHAWYPQSEKFRTGSKSRIPVFLCGGGAHIAQFREMVTQFTGFRADVQLLPMPGSIEGFSDVTAFHRLSVAYGLSLNSRNLAQVWKREADPSIRVRHEVDFGDRDADR